MSEISKNPSEEERPVDLMPLFAEALEEYKKHNPLVIAPLAEAYTQWLMSSEVPHQSFLNHRDYLEFVGCPPSRVQAVISQSLTNMRNHYKDLLQKIRTPSNS